MFLIYSNANVDSSELHDIKYSLWTSNKNDDVTANGNRSMVKNAFILHRYRYFNYWVFLGWRSMFVMWGKILSRSTISIELSLSNRFHLYVHISKDAICIIHSINSSYLLYSRVLGFFLKRKSIRPNLTKDKNQKTDKQKKEACC